MRAPALGRIWRVLLSRLGGLILKQKFVTGVLFLMIATIMFGCGRRRHRAVVVHPTHGKAIIIKKGHAHGARCGHFRHGNTWYMAKKGHVHRARCGHHHVKGVWIIR